MEEITIGASSGACLCNSFASHHSALALSKSSSFRDICSERHPNLFGLIGARDDDEEIWTTLYDIKFKEWLSIQLVGPPRSYYTGTCLYNDPYEFEGDVYTNPLFACDGGLVCFVLPEPILITSPIVVC